MRTNKIDIGSGPNRRWCPVEHRGEIFCPYVPPPRLAQAISRLAQTTSRRERQMDGWKDGQTDGWTEFPPVFYRTSSSIGSAARPTFSFSTTANGRARVPLTSWCLWRLINDTLNRTDPLKLKTSNHQTRPYGVYTASDALKHVHKRRQLRTYGRTEGLTDGRTDPLIEVRQST